MARTRATKSLVLAFLFVLGAAGSARAVDQLIAGDDVVVHHL